MTKVLITSALPYVNGVKHLGNLAGSLLPADVHARFRRQIGDDVLFICATDEHGTPAELGAIQSGQDIRAFCDQQHAIQADIYRRFGHFCPTAMWWGRVRIADMDRPEAINATAAALCLTLWN